MHLFLPFFTNAFSPFEISLDKDTTGKICFHPYTVIQYQDDGEFINDFQIFLIFQMSPASLIPYL